MNISFKEIILLYITIQGFISYVPQIVKIAKTKSSEDISIASWLFWTINSALYLLYLLLDKVNIWLILSQLLEVILIGTTLVFVIIYKKTIRACKGFDRVMKEITASVGHL